MRSVKSKDTKPELAVRRLVHALGYRFRLHRRDLPGTPDIVLLRLGKIINVHGCFWHAHGCRHGRVCPVKNAAYWQAKRARNAARDRRNRRAASAGGVEGAGPVGMPDARPATTGRADREIFG